MFNFLRTATNFDKIANRWTSISGTNWIKIIFLVIIFSIVNVLFVSRFLLGARIYIPGLYFIPQLIVYKVHNLSAGPFYAQEFFFFIIGFAINFPVVLIGYFFIGRRYGITSFVAISIWTSLGVLFSLEPIRNALAFAKINFVQFQKGVARAKDVQYYIIALFAGLFAGFASSLLWRKNISLGGLDTIFTYLAIKTKKEIQKVTLPISACFGLIAIVVNEYNQVDFNFQVFLSFLFASLLFIYVRNTTINYFYPKYKIVSILIITKKPNLVRKELNNFYYRGGNLIASRGLYDQQDKTIIITAMTYLEKDLFVSRIKKIDPEAFFIGVNTALLEGNFPHQDLN